MFVLPLFTITEVPIGPITLQSWGIMVSLGFLTGVLIAAKKAEQKHLAKEFIYDLALWVIIGAIIGSRIFFLFEFPGYFLENPIEILKIWNGGLSMSGGIAGAFMAGIIVVRRGKKNFWKYADTIIFGLPLGIFVGRIGCSLIHDHLGRICNLPFCVDFGGVIRHEPAYYLSLNGLILFGVFWFLRKKNIAKKQGFYTTFFLIWYGISRFLIDFTRDPLVERHFFGLSIAQIFGLLLFGGGIYLAYKNNLINLKKKS